MTAAIVLAELLYCVLGPARQVTVVDPALGRVRAAIPLAFEPTGLASGGGRLYVTGDGAVHVIEAGRVVRRIAAGAGAGSPVLAPDGKKLYVLNRFANSVSVIDPLRARPLAAIGVPREPYAADITPDGATLVVGCHLPVQPSTADHVAAEVCLIDSRGPRCILLPNGSTSVRGVAVSPDGRRAYVTHILARYTVHTTQLEQGWMNTNALSVIDVAGRALLNTVLLDEPDDGAANPWAVAVTRDGRYILVTHAGAGELSVIDAAALEAKLKGRGDVSDDLGFLTGLRHRIRLPGRGPRALATAGSSVWVAEYFSNSIARLDLGQPSRVDSIALGGPEAPATVRRGEMLFHDAGACFQRWQSCSSCHPDGRSDGLNWDLLNDGLGNPKNTKSLLYTHRSSPVMSTGVRPSAEHAVRAGRKFILFGDPEESEMLAIDEYLKSLRPAPSPYPPGPAARRGQRLFLSREAGCSSCHRPPLYTDGELHDVGSHASFDFTLDTAGGRTPQRSFKTPSLIEAWRTAPYFHDGRYATVRDAIVQGNCSRGAVSRLSESQIGDLVQFVLSL